MTTLPIHTSCQDSTSVFDRLYSKSTESSRLRKSAAGKETENTGDISALKSFNSYKRIPPRSQPPRLALKSKTNLISSQTLAGSSEVYNRLYSKGTASYNSKRKIITKKSQSKACDASNKTS